MLPFYGFMNEDDASARDVVGNRTVDDPGAAFAGGDGQGEAQSEEPQGMDAGLSGSPDGTASGDAPKRLWVERAMPRLLDSEADEYFDFARFAEEQKEVQRKLADGWSMKGSSRYTRTSS